MELLKFGSRYVYIQSATYAQHELEVKTGGLQMESAPLSDK